MKTYFIFEEDVNGKYLLLQTRFNTIAKAKIRAAELAKTYTGLTYHVHKDDHTGLKPLATFKQKENRFIVTLKCFSCGKRVRVYDLLPDCVLCAKCEKEVLRQEIAATDTAVEVGEGNKSLGIRRALKDYQWRGCRQTACRLCGQDIEGHFPYRKGEWHDRGNNSECPDNSGNLHTPIK